MIYIRLVSERWSPISAAIRFGTRDWPSHAELISTTHPDQHIQACHDPGGHVADVIVRNHVRRGITNPTCQLCQAEFAT